MSHPVEPKQSFTVENDEFISDEDRRCAAKYCEVLERTGDKVAAERAYVAELNNAEFLQAEYEPMNFSFTPDPVQERHETRVLTVAFVIMFAMSGVAWYLSIKHFGFWWTVLLSHLLGS